MTRIDRLFFSLLLVASLQVVVVLTLTTQLLEISSDIGALRLTEQPGTAVLYYYPFRALQVAADMTPFAVLVGVFLSLGRLARRNEIAPLLLAGISPRRLALSSLAAGFLIAVALAYANHSLLPWAVKKASWAQYFLHENWQTTLGQPVRHAYMITPEGDSYYFGELYPPTSTARNVKFTVYDPMTGRPAMSVEGLEAQWKEDRWEVKDAVLRRFLADTSMSEIPLSQAATDSGLQLLQYPLELLIPRHWDMSGMNSQELEGFHRRMMAHGSTGKAMVSEFHRRWAEALVPLLLICLAIPQALRAEKASFWPRFFLAFALMVLFFATQFFSVYLLGNRFPQMAIWAAPLAWLAWGLGRVLFSRA